LPRLAPKLKHYLPRPYPAWPDIVDAADRLSSDLGISKSLWGEGCLAMGRELACGQNPKAKFARQRIRGSAPIRFAAAVAAASRPGASLCQFATRNQGASKS
jgi:replication protein C-like